MSVRFGLLALLDGADKYGYQLKSEYEERTGGIWALNIGQVYSTLDRLVRDGLVAATAESAPVGGREQKFYAITDAGRDELAAWFAESAGGSPLPRDELVAKVLLATARGRGHALDVITRQRTALTAALQARRRASRAAGGGAGARATRRAATTAAPEDPVRLAPAMVEDAMITRAEADLRWLDLCEARLRRSAGGGNDPP